MAKSNNNQKKPAVPQQAPKKAPVAQKAVGSITPKQPVAQKAPEKNTLQRYMPAIIMAAIAIVVFIALRVCLDNQWTNWDDPGYVKDNHLVKDVTSEGLKNIFTTAVMGNYHPLTMLSLALEYHADDLQPFIYHRDSLIIHILCALAIFWLIYLITKSYIASAFTSLLFALHPMHMESVAWIAARKDVMYGFFYIASLIFYIYYIREQKQKKLLFYILSIILFLCSILSKPVAVILPVTLFLFDYYLDRPLFNASSGKKFEMMVYLEKIPYLLISLGFGIRSLNDQKDFKALNTLDVHFSFLERIALGAYAFVTYSWKAIVPMGMSNFYPYPEKENDILPFHYYWYILALLAIIALVWWFSKKSKAVLFGFLFFLVNIILLLQFIPVGGAILADRYTYIPYLGIIFIAGKEIAGLYESKKKPMLGNLLLGLACVYLIVCGFISSKRCADWHDTISLWSDEVVKHPDVPSAFNNLGFEYFNLAYVDPDPKKREAELDSAEKNLKIAVQEQPNFVNPYVSLGEVARARNNFPEAKRYYYQALKLSKDDEAHNAYLGLGIIYAISGQELVMRRQPEASKMYFDSAQFCFSSAIKVKPYFPEAHSNFGNFWDMMGNFDSSYRHYTIAIEQNPDMYASYLNRARLLQRHQRCDEAFKDFNKAAEVAPDMGEIYYGRAHCYRDKGDIGKAIQDVQLARKLGFTQVDQELEQALKR